MKSPLWFLFAAVGVLLLIACSNVASLLLARSAYRRPELIIRAALGAGHGRILRQWLAETLLLALAGGIAAIILARVALAATIALVPPDLLQITTIPLDHRVLLYTLGLSILTGVVFAMVAAMMTSRSSLANDLRTARRATPHSARLRQGIIVAQIAMTVVLLSGSGLLARSLRELSRTDLGLDPRNVLSLNVGLDGEPYDSRGRQYVAFYQQVIERVGSLPGVRSVSAEERLPVLGGLRQTTFDIEGTRERSESERSSTSARMVTPGHFRTLGIPVVRGRDFSVNDQRQSPLVFIVNQAFANAFLSDGDPLSASISLSLGPEDTYGRIIGVVGDVKEGSLKGQAEPTVFYTYGQISTSTDMLPFVKATNAQRLAQAAVQVIHDIDSKIPVTEVRLLEEAFGESISRERLGAVVSSAFALTALLLAACGVYGLLSFRIAERRQEIGIRMALGAKASSVLWMVMRHGFQLVLPAVLLGLAGAFALSQWLESFLFEVTPHDPVTFVGVVTLLVAISAVATFAPARRATQVDPLIVLREE